MKVYYVSNRYDGCWYVRCYLPLYHNGWDGDKTSPYSPRVRDDQKARGALNADIVVFHRPDHPNTLEIAKMLKQAGKKIVFDNDDTFIPDSGVPTQVEDLNGKAKLKEMHDTMNEFMKLADMVTTTTDFLADEYYQINPNVKVLPNMVDPEDWDEPQRNEGDKVRIGMIGSVASNKNYENIIPLLEKYQDDDRVELVMMGMPKQAHYDKFINNAYREEMKFWKDYNVELHHFVPQNEYNEAVNDLLLDIMLIPRHDSYFNRAKSNIKFLEASMLEIPVIAQGFADGRSPYQGKDEDYLKLAFTPEDWINQTEELIKSKKQRREMGRRAKDYVLENYNINNTKNQWYDAYRKLMR